MTDPVRLAKRVAELRGCSRREAEQYIAGGWVKVDGIVVEEPQFRVADQRIDIDPHADLAQAEPVTLLLHKPPGYCTTEGEPPASQLLTPDTLWPEDRAGIRPLKKHFAQLTLCVPLETDASGLVVFTQDWRIARKRTEDAATLEHEVIVEVAGEMVPNGLKRLNRGIPFNGRTPPTIKVSWQNETRLRVALKGAQIGQIAHLCEAVGLQVLSMKRIRLGRVPLGKLPEGQWRYLLEDERF
ncbi:MAG TPA: rRNA pseudouridine synthase [Thiobacillus sp.]|nr:MAG: RNA-binding protein [Hydrogenophilales bacterium 16-64-40]OZA33110.1 MAG: RNA-binding protein [Hydrogenophilales bacterium 17-64-65]HQS81583.1 rRNA pseudouridine synthase [Thiobacillus sp.]HQT34784.1 rRNA pseudouridine synthase [Thiobacillus sp.]